MIEQKIRENLHTMAHFFDGDILAKILDIAQRIDNWEYTKNLVNATVVGIHTEPLDAKLLSLEVTFVIPLEE